MNTHTPGPLEVSNGDHHGYVRTVKADQWGNHDPVCCASQEDAEELAERELQVYREEVEEEQIVTDDERSNGPRAGETR